MVFYTEVSYKPKKQDEKCNCKQNGVDFPGSPMTPTGGETALSDVLLSKDAARVKVRTSGRTSGTPSPCYPGDTPATTCNKKDIQTEVSTECISI
jgi:hypothetical protein